jgi:anaerobic nitric oxide reductase flavorubredoxin
MHQLIKNNISWVGKSDWDLRTFHGNEYSTHLGSSYNSYLVREEKVALIDTVWLPFAKEFVANLQQEIDLKKIDYIIANHGEVDHSGALPELLRYIPDVPIYCTANGVKSMRGQYHQDWNFNVVKTGDRLSLGQKELIFIETPMMHWPDNMITYLTGDNVLFSNDAFGQHFASEHLFNDLVNQDDLYAEALKYYANILAPFNHLVTKKVKEFIALNLPLDIICTSHGIIWRHEPQQIIDKYLLWANDYQENQVTIVYDTMWGGTRMIAENIAKGVHLQDPSVGIKVFNASNTDKNDIIAEIFKSKALVLGSPTINSGILTSIAALLEEIKGIRFKKKKAAVFGCYGWSGEANKIVVDELKKAGFEVIDDGIKFLWLPDAVALSAGVEYGKKLAEDIASK